MRLIRNLGILSLFVFMAGITGIGCGSSNKVTPAIAVAFSPALPASLQTGATASLTATVTNDSANKGVTWSCLPANACGSFNPTATASGASTTYTAPATVPAGGSVTITAASVSDNIKNATGTITITAPPAISVAFSPALPATLQAGASTSLGATVTNDSANKGVTWSCLPANACGSFNPTATASGASTTYTAPATVPAGGSVTITATSVSDNTKNATGTITITPPPPIVVTFSLAPPASINASTTTTPSTASIAASVANDSANKGVTWSCAPTNACGSFNPTATASAAVTTFTAPQNTGQGPSLIITATSVSDPTKSVQATVAFATTGVLSVAITQSPTQQSIQTGATATLAATVSNDPSNSGVTWSCLPANVCGSFNPTSTASGATTTYTAPATLPQSPQVTLTATTVATPAQSASIILNIFSPGTQNARLNGQYAFSLNGQVGSLELPTVGSVTLDGNGNVTAGEFDQPGDGSPNFTQVPVTGTYSVGADGRGAMTLSFSNSGVPGNQIGLNFALTSNSHGVIVETDGLISASGSLDLQSAGPNFALTQITGGYSFAFAGVDIANSTSLVTGGIFTANGTTQLTNGTIDTNDNGALSSAAFTATITAPDSFGRGTITASNNDTFVYYMVTPEVLRIVETDRFFTTGGSAYGQGSAASFTDASLTGSFVFGALGQSPNAGTAVAGQFTTDGAGNVLAGTADSVTADGATVTAVALTNSTYSFTASPRGTFTVVGGTNTFNVYLTDPALNLLDPNNPKGGGGALIIENDATAFLVGEVIPQALPATSTFSGSYAINLTALQNQGLGADFELDLSGQATASGGNSYSGLADYAGTAAGPTNSLLEPVVVGSATAGTLTADGTNPGRFTGTLTITPPAGTTYFLPQPTTNATLGLSYYQASSTQLLFIQINGGEVALGVLEQ